MEGNLPTFIILDHKADCFGYYLDGELRYDLENLPEDGRTWKFSPHIKSDKVEYAYLYVGMELDSICPEFFRGKWDKVNNKMKAFLNSFSEAKISLDDNCLYDMIPEQFLLEYFSIQTKIVDHIFDTVEKPSDYEHRVSLHKLLNRISNLPLKLDKNAVKDRLANAQVRDFVGKLNQWKNIKYDQFGTKTGRLTNTKDSFPVLTMNKNLRNILKPQNHFFVEYDYNAAEVRVFLSLAGWEQPEGDIHQWNADRIFKGEKTRAEVKQEFLGWLYNPSDDREFGAFYKRQEVLNKYYDGCYIRNPFGRKIEADQHHALNYIIQSTTTDLVQRQAIKIDDFLKDKKSNVAFTVHDSVVVDLHVEDKDLIEKIANIFSDTRFGKFKANVSAGRDFGTLEELDV